MRIAITSLMLVMFVCPFFAEETEQERIDRFFNRMREAAHPTPIKSLDRKKKKRVLQEMIPSAVLDAEQSKFLNSNTIVFESDALPVQNESSIAINPKNPQNLIASAVDYRANSSTWVYVSNDGGKTWENKNLGRTYPGWASSNDPSVMFDKDGTGYLVYGSFPAAGSGAQNGVYFARTTDEGKTWTTAIPVIEHTGQLTIEDPFEDKYYIQVDNGDDSPYRGRLFVPWKRMMYTDSSTQILLSYSNDKGDSWSAPIAVSDRLPNTVDDTTFGQSWPLTANGPAGEVYAVWHHGIEHAFGFNKSTDGGLTWGQPRVIHHYGRFGTTTKLDQGWRHTVKGTVRAEAYPVIKTDYSATPYKGNVYMCWAADSIPNVYFSRSADGGENWTAPMVVHSKTEGDQFWPWMGVDPLTGDIAIMYLDSRNDPENIMTDCYVSYSQNGGMSWIDRRVSTEPWDLRHNPFGQRAFAGDYSGLDFYDGIIYPSWVDMRHTTDDDYSDNDVYTSIVNTKAPSPVEDLVAEILPDKPKELKVSWNNVFESTFGSQIPAKDLKLLVFRNGEFYKEMSMDIEQLDETGLVSFEPYRYDIYVAHIKDTSAVATAIGYPGGSKLPGRPLIERWRYLYPESSEIQADLWVRIPGVRADNITPLVNLSAMEIYENGTLKETIPLAQDDAGKLKRITLSYTEAGYRNHSVKLVADYKDGSEPQQSEESNSVFVYAGGTVDEYTENFDGPMPAYYLSPGWKQNADVAYSAPNSFSNSIDGAYANNTRDTFLLLPFSFREWSGDTPEHLQLRFRNLAAVATNDSCIVEYSQDSMATWKKFTNFNEGQYEPWKLADLDPASFREETLPIKLAEGVYDKSLLFVRFRFYSNPFVTKKGWFVDDISTGYIATRVGEEDEESVEVYPNPASRYVTVQTSDPTQVKVIDILGHSFDTEAMRIFLDEQRAVFDLSRLNAGIYFVIAGGRQHKLMINK